MNQFLVEFQVKKLLFFFENHPRNEKVLIPQEYKNWMRGVLALMVNCAENLVWPELAENLNLRNIKDKQDLRKELQKMLWDKPDKTSIDYNGIYNILKTYWTLVTQPEQKKLSGEDWANIIGYLRDLELERLSVRRRK